MPLQVRSASGIGPVPVAPTRDLVGALVAGTPFYVAHRMGGTEYPEFTRTGMEASLRAGFKALEVSVRRCSTGEFVAIHDWKTTRTAKGSDYEIWKTPWSTLSTLRQGAGPFMRLSDIVDAVPADVVLAIDHKETSDRVNTNPDAIHSENLLLDYLDTAFAGKAQDRVLWKHFYKADIQRATERGYRTMCMMYESELPNADLSKWDVLGLEWNASGAAWDSLNATGKPTIAHIITDGGQATQAFNRGAKGLMASFPTRVHP